MSDQETPPDAPGLAERLASMERTLQRMEQALDPLGARAPGPLAPGPLARLTEAMDEVAADADARGIDLDAVLRAVLELVTRLAEIAQSPEFKRLTSSGLLSLESIDVAAHGGDALAATRAEANGKAGLMDLLCASRDPDVQRALDFGIRFMKRFGRALAAPAPAPDDETPQPPRKTA